MPKAELTVSIARRAEDVFDYVTEFTNNPHWRPDVIETWWDDPGPTRPGRRGGQAARIMGRRLEVTAEIVDWDPPRYASWKTVQGGATVVAYCRIDPDGAGCRLIYGADGHVNGPLGIVFNPLLGPIMTRTFRKDLARLKTILETPVGPASVA